MAEAQRAGRQIPAPKQKETLSPIRPIEESQKLADTMMETLIEAINISKELKDLGILRAKGENIDTLQKAYAFFAELNSFYDLTTTPHPLAKKLLAVCKNYPGLNGSFGEAFNIFRVNLLRKLEAKKIADQIN